MVNYSFQVFKIFLTYLILIPFSFASTQTIQKFDGAVVTEHNLATNVGMKILKEGGNAIDAAVAVGYALAVVNPCCGNIGGNGFMLIHLANGKNIFLNFRSKAPLAATPNMFLDTNNNIIPNKSINTYAAVAVPGTVLGFETALKKYGTFSRQKVMAPAIQLASQGYTLSQGDIKIMEPYLKEFSKSPNVAAIFFKNSAESMGSSSTVTNKIKIPYVEGDNFIQTNLADTLSLISKNGPSVFYKGKIANEVVEASRKNNGILSLKDFAEYSVQPLQPVMCQYHGYKIYSAAPPSSGGTTLCEILNIIRPYDLKKMGFHTVESTHYLAEAMRFAFYDRNTLLGDPDFVSNPIDQLTSEAYANKIREKIKPIATSADIFNTETSNAENVHTTHYSIVDKYGNAVAVTYTLNSLFGSGLMAGNTGFFLNNDMDDFTLKSNEPNQFGLVMGKKNEIQPGKRPLSSMTPTIITKNNKLVMVIGSPGGPRIITSVLETIINVLDYGMTLQDAVNAPRFHHQAQPDLIYAEPNAFTIDVIKGLEKTGHHIKEQKTWGAVEAIYLQHQGDTINVYTAQDPRRVSG